MWKIELKLLNMIHPTISQQVKFYNEYWAEIKPFSDSKLSRIIKILKYLQWVRKSIHHPKILDFGCGDGRAVAIWNETGCAVGLDLSNEAIKAASERYPALEFHNGNAIESEFTSCTFDVIISQEVIEHILDQKNYINECFRLLRPGGFLILTTPNKYFFNRRKGGNYSYQPIENILSPKQLKELINYNFKIIKFESIICAQGDFGIYRILSNRFFIASLRKLGLDKFRRYLIEKNLLGLHLCSIAQKK